MKTNGSRQEHHKKHVVIHAEKRAKERYGLWFPDEVLMIAKEIKRFRDNGSNMFVGRNNPVMLLYRERRDPTKVHYLIEFRLKFYWAVWATHMQTINTFLPLDGLKSKLGNMSNSIAGFLAAKNLINVDEYKLCDVGEVHKKEELNNAEVLEPVCVHNDPATLHRSVHSLPQQSMDGRFDSLHHMTIIDQNHLLRGCSSS